MIRWGAFSSISSGKVDAAELPPPGKYLFADRPPYGLELDPGRGALLPLHRAAAAAQRGGAHHRFFRRRNTSAGCTK